MNATVTRHPLCGAHLYIAHLSTFFMIFLYKRFKYILKPIFTCTGLAGKNLSDLFPRVRGKKELLTSFSPGFSPQWGKNLFRLICSHNPSDRDPPPITLFLFCLRVIWDRTEHTYIDSKTISIDNTTYPIIITNRV